VIRSRILRSRLRERFLVTTKDGAAFSGLLYSLDKKALVLREAEAVQAAEDKSNLPLDGEVIIFASDVAYMQRPGGLDVRQ
jgi:small nuclear ribonucleoprotein (snRNP)-like protein